VALELNVVALYKGEEHFIFVFDDGSRDQLLDFMRDQAADPDVSFNWFDAALLTQKVREQVAESPASPQRQRLRTA
jgi:hypothetical protein